MRIGGFWLSMVRICTGLVCVRSTLTRCCRRLAGCLHVEGVVLLPRGMLGRDVELGEVVVVGLDVRALGDGKAHVAEDLGHLVEHLADGMDASVLQGAEAHGQRDVGLLAGETGRERPRSSSALRASSASLTRALSAIDRLAERLALLGRKRAELGHQLGHAALLAERGDAHALDARRGRAAAPISAISAPSMAAMSVVLCHDCCHSREARPRDPVNSARSRRSTSNCRR